MRSASFSELSWAASAALVDDEISDTIETACPGHGKLAVCVTSQRYGVMDKKKTIYPLSLGNKPAKP